jgi:predicted DNA-binding antitoxin AbrB/MazE fold protein
VPTTVWAKVSQGKIELLEPIDLPEGARVLVTLVPSSEEEPLPEPKPEVLNQIEPEILNQIEPDFWLQSEPEDLIWDNIGNEDSEPLLSLPSPLPLSRSEHRSE